MDTVVKIFALLAPHLAFVGFMLVNAIIEHTLEANIFTRAMTFKGQPRWLWIWGRKVLPLIPLLNGAVIAIFWVNPEPGVESYSQRLTYFMSSGALSIFAYNVIVSLAKKQGVDLRVPGETEIPPAPPVPRELIGSDLKDK